MVWQLGLLLPLWSANISFTRHICQVAASPGNHKWFLSVIKEIHFVTTNICCCSSCVPLWQVLAFMHFNAVKSMASNRWILYIISGIGKQAFKTHHRYMFCNLNACPFLAFHVLGLIIKAKYFMLSSVLGTIRRKNINHFVLFTK